MRFCPNIKGFCLKNEWAAGTFALLGAATLFATIWVAINFQPLIYQWLKQDILSHGLLFGAAVLADLLLVFGLLCLGFGECAEEDRKSPHTYRGRRSELFPEVLDVVEAIGSNPRRRPRDG